MLVRGLDEETLRRQYPNSARILRDFGFGYQPGQLVPYARVLDGNASAEFLALASSPGVYHKVSVLIEDVDIIPPVLDTVPTAAAPPAREQERDPDPDGDGGPQRPKGKTAARRTPAV